MRYIILFMGLCFFTLLSIIPAQATDLPRLLIVGDDSSPQSLSRTSRPFKEVIDSISESLLNDGFDVKDEYALTDGPNSNITNRRNESEVIHMAKKLGVDIAIIFSIYPNKTIIENSVRIQPRINGRMISVYDGSRMGNFNIKSQRSAPVNKPYSRNDQEEAVTDIAAILGQEVGTVLTERLAQYVDSENGRLQEWTIVIDGFKNFQVMDMEDTFKRFTGYDSHRTIPNADSYRNHNEFFYKSSSDSAKLVRNFNKMLKNLNLKGTVTVSGLKISITKNKGLKSRIIQQNSW